MIEVKNLTKMYGRHAAVKDLSFTVQKGKIYGFLGPNGAGKSTTMNIITGCLAATEGEVKIGGHDIFEEPVPAKSLIGYLPEQPPLYPDMTPYEYLCFVAEAKGVPRGEIDDRVDEAMEETSIEDVADRLIRNLSKGYRQRVGLAQAMLGNPEVIILDEPTVGLDPSQIIEIRRLIKSLGSKHTVILSSHILSEISAVCDHVIIISRGKIVANDTIENLSIHYTGKSTMLLRVKAQDGKVRMILNAIPEIIEYEITPSAEMGDTLDLKLTIPREADIRERLFNAFAEDKLPILSMTTESLSLEDVFLMLTREAEDEYEGYASDDIGIIDGEDSDGYQAGKPQEPIVFGVDIAADKADESDEADETDEDGETDETDKTDEADSDKKTKTDKPTGRKSAKNDDDDYTPMFGGKL